MAKKATGKSKKTASKAVAKVSSAGWLRSVSF